ncbi:MAG: 5-methyltetrahydropteroyltriglutamate--homocysteine S-methyltransferase, partial [Bacteroidales bacterium]|nr:5-methyltetrahydropteroyltriglutamate--homocysteine S-methyltransferase [Bacteroidales bacterium]
MTQIIKTNVLGFPRIGRNRELKKAEEAYWNGKSSIEQLLEVARAIRLENWKIQSQAGVKFIPSNDFSFYDQVLDQTLALGVIPERYNALKNNLIE